MIFEIHGYLPISLRFTQLLGSPPLSTLTTSSQAALRILAKEASESEAMCGVTISFTLSSVNRGSPGLGGSYSSTSRPAPAMSPATRAFGRGVVRRFLLRWVTRGRRVGGDATRRRAGVGGGRKPLRGDHVPDGATSQGTQRWP